MKIIGIDSSGLVATVAILSDETLVAEYTIDYKKTHSTTLMPMLDEILKMTETTLDSIDAIAVSKGPGSFTGLRIGSATAKGLAYSLNIPIIPISTLESMAYNIQFFDGIICPIMDARRGQVYNALYSFLDGDFKEIEGERAIEVKELVLELEEKYKGREVVFLGDGVPVYKKEIENSLSLRSYFADSNLSRQRAGSLVSLAKRYYNMGRIETSSSHIPTYIRQSQAEREREESIKGE